MMKRRTTERAMERQQGHGNEGKDDYNYDGAWEMATGRGQQ